MNHLVPKLLQIRFAVPILIAAVLTLAGISELTYQRSFTTLTGGIKLTDARIGAANLLQLLTDAETAQRGYLLTENTAYLQPLQRAEQQFNEGVAILDFISTIGPTGPADALFIKQKVAAKFAELRQTVELASLGDRSAALVLVRTDSGKQLMDELRVIFQRSLDEAARLQQEARQTIYAALWFNRLAVVMLSFVLALGIYLHALQLKRFNKVSMEYQKTLELSVSEKTNKLRTLTA